MTRISDLQISDTLLCWMRPNYPLQANRDPKGRWTYVAAGKIPSRFRANHFTHFWGRVSNNYPSEKVIELLVTPIRSPLKVTYEPSYTALIHYSTFKRVHLISAFSYPGSPTLPLSRPTKSTPLSGTNPEPYHTSQNVVLK